ncbi:MAG: fibrobacter succinogenes major paralogous domain-containing protein [Lentimicrobiaceae bacterium]|nr:fibrobacter succinogenes major paralogous domain-containing protein [Lentimicrobiaceae bacterium]
MKKLYYLAILAVLFAACDKDGSSPVAPGEISGKIAATYPDSVIINGVVPTTATEAGICWDTVGSPTRNSDHATVKPSTDGKITATIHNLLPGQKYYVKIYASDNGEIRYSEAIPFVTKPQWVNTGTASGVELHQATLNGTIDPIVSGVETTFWFEWGETSSYGNKTPEQTIGRLKSSTAVKAVIDGLDWHKTYHFCLFVKTNGQIVQGRNCSFLTRGNIPDVIEVVIDSNNFDKFIIKTTVNPNLIATSVVIEWGETNVYDHVTNPQSVGSTQAAQAAFEIPVPERALQYHFRVKAENALGATYTRDTTSVSLALVDRYGNKFHACKIGNQYWLTANWRVLHYNNGDPIPNITDPVAWGEQTSGALCFYDNNQANYEVYGPLYNWFVIADPRGICPPGWHVPSWYEWRELYNFLGGIGSTNGGKLKEAGLTHWFPENFLATNSTGFTALPAGARAQTTYDPTPEEKGTFYLIHEYAYFWTADEVPGDSSAWDVFLIGSSCRLWDYGAGWKYYGESIRLIKD